MANKILKSLQFPGFLQNTYVIPEPIEVDATLTQSGQAADAKVAGDEIDSLKSDFTVITGASAITLTQNQFVDLSGTSVIMNAGTPIKQNTNNFNCAVLPCVGGDVFTISGIGGSSGRLWGFVDSEGTVISKARSGAEETEKMLDAPSDSAWFIINNSVSSDSVSYIGEKLSTKIDSVNIELNSKINDTRGILNTSGVMNVPVMENGKVISYNGGISDSSNSAITDYIPVVSGTTVYLKNVYLNGSRAIVGYDSEKVFKQAILTGIEDSNVLIEVPDGISYLRATSHNNEQCVYMLDVFNTINTIKEDLADDTDILITLSYQPINAYYVNYSTGTLTRSTNYSYTSPIKFKSGDRIVISAAGDAAVAILSRYDNTTNTYTPVVRGINPSQEVKQYNYTVELDGDYVISYRSTTAEAIINLIKSEGEIVLDLLNKQMTPQAIEGFKTESITPNITIKAFKTLNYSDKTQPKYSQVLWNDPITDEYYISTNVYSDKNKIFKWDASIADGSSSAAYSAVVLPSSDILFVFQTQFYNSSTEADGVYRRNPIIYKASEDYMPTIIDFGDNLKPTGWLQNVGVHYSYHYNKLYIAEYTRANEASANIWRVDMPVTDPSNWHVLLNMIIEKPYGSVFKHFHTAQEDPYTNILYFSSGDLDTSSYVWYTLDGGKTSLIPIDNPDAGKYRMLNMAFTEDYVYWASDQWEPEHFLWKCTRDSNTGVLDVQNGLTKILEFDDIVPSGQPHAWVATYATVYLSAYNALVFLDRDDHGEHDAIPIRIYDIDSGSLYTAGIIEDISGGNGAFGFRNVAVECYPKSNEIAVSYDFNSPNNIKILGNTENKSNKINNLILRVYKTGTGYKITFDTIY